MVKKVLLRERFKIIALFVFVCVTVGLLTVAVYPYFVPSSSTCVLSQNNLTGAFTLGDAKKDPPLVNPANLEVQKELVIVNEDLNKVCC